MKGRKENQALPNYQELQSQLKTCIARIHYNAYDHEKVVDRLKTELFLYQNFLEKLTLTTKKEEKKVLANWIEFTVLIQHWMNHPNDENLAKVMSYNLPGNLDSFKLKLTAMFFLFVVAPALFFFPMLFMPFLLHTPIVIAVTMVLTTIFAAYQAYEFGHALLEDGRQSGVLGAVHDLSIVLHDPKYLKAYNDLPDFPPKIDDFPSDLPEFPPEIDDSGIVIESDEELEFRI